MPGPVLRGAFSVAPAVPAGAIRVRLRQLALPRRLLLRKYVGDTEHTRLCSTPGASGERRLRRCDGRLQSPASIFVGPSRDAPRTQFKRAGGTSYTLIYPRRLERSFSSALRIYAGLDRNRESDLGFRSLPDSLSSDHNPSTEWRLSALVVDK